MNSLKDVVTHPISYAVGVLGTVVSVTHLDVIAPVVMTVWASVPDLFTLSSILAFTIAPRVDGLSVEWATTIALTLGALWAGKLGLQFLRKLGNRFNDDT